MKFEFPRLYTSLAKYYDKLESQYRDYDLEAKWLSKLFEESNAKIILDISCGTASHVSRLTSLLPSCEFIATDASKEMLCITHKKVGKKVDIVESDYLESPFRINSFDSVICMYWSIAGLDSLLTKRLFSNISSILRPSGVFVFDTENSQGIKEDLLGKPFIDTSFTVGDGMITRINHSEKIASDLVDWKSYYLHETAAGVDLTIDRMKLRFFSKDQIASMLDFSGFRLESVLSSGLKEYYKESPTLYFVARKR